MAVEDSATPQGILAILCDDKKLRASSNGEAVVYDKDCILGVIVDENELFHHQRICSIRVALREYDLHGLTICTLPFLTSSTGHRDVFVPLAKQIVSLDLGVPTYDSPDSFVQAMRQQGIIHDVAGD